MKSVFYLFCLLLISSFAPCFAQEEAVSEEELKNYAIVMDSIEDMRQSLLNSMSEAIKGNDQITAARYNELSKIIKDSEKLKAANATDTEIAAVNKVLTEKEEGAAKIQETFKTLVKDMLGAATYNKVKKSLSTNAELKTKYESMLAEINKAEGTD